MTKLTHTLKRVLTASAAIAMTTLGAAPLSAVAAVNVAQLEADLAQVEARSVAPPFMSAALGADTDGLKGAIYDVEMLLDFPDTGFVSPLADTTGSVRVSDLERRALTNRATLVERACLIVDTAAGGGRPNLGQIAARLDAIQAALTYVARPVALTTRPSLGSVEDTVQEIVDIMDFLSAEGPAVDNFGDGSVRVSQLHDAVEDIYNRAAFVCANYPL